MKGHREMPLTTNLISKKYKDRSKTLNSSLNEKFNILIFISNSDNYRNWY